MSMIFGRLPTVPEYYMEFIDSNVDLTVTPKQCCPFHKESSPSFSYNIPTGRWSCFGSCHAHGDVVEMHKRWFHFRDRESALRDLEERYNVPEEDILKRIQREKNSSMYVNMDKAELESRYSLACTLANTKERWLELDYVMSKYPINSNELIILINKWRNK